MSKGFENPCFECVCLAMCVQKTITKASLDCAILREFTSHVEDYIPRCSYRYVTAGPNDHTYEVEKRIDGRCDWKNRSVTDDYWTQRNSVYVL